MNLSRAQDELRVDVVVPTPAHSTMGATLSYRSELPLAPGLGARPLGQREVCGVVWDAPPDSAERPSELKPVGARWRACRRCRGLAPARRSPPAITSAAWARSRCRRCRPSCAASTPCSSPAPLNAQRRRPRRPRGITRELTEEQEQALARSPPQPGPSCCSAPPAARPRSTWAVQALMQRDPQAQALVLVPEINLTPQLQARFEERFGTAAVVPLHSGMTTRSGCAAGWRTCRARASCWARAWRCSPRCPDWASSWSTRSTTQLQAAGRRPLFRARPGGLPRPAGRGQGDLGSATPSLESWQACERGRYRCLEMPARVGAGVLPRCASST